MGKNKINKPLDATLLRRFRIAGLLSVFGLVSLNTRNMHVLFYPDYGDDLLTVFVYALCFIGAGVAVLAELARVGEPPGNRRIQHIRLVTALFALIPVAVGVVFAVAVFASWRGHRYFTANGMSRFDWYMSVGFGILFVVMLLSIPLRHGSIRFPRKWRKVFRRGK